MKCSKARESLSDQHNGELSPRAEEGLRAHLGQCAACRAAQQEHGEMMDLIARTEAPALPPDFGATLHQRLVEENTREPVENERTWRGGWPLWLRVVRNAGLVATGAAMVLLFMWLRPTPVTDRAAGSTGSPPITEPRPLTPDRVAVKSVPRPAPRPAPAQELRLGQVAVLVLSIRADTDRPNARLQVLLPDGLVLLGEGYQELEEKLMTWRADLVSGENVIRIPVRAHSVGVWRLVARAHAAGFQSQTETRLVVSKT
jgi:hypothetical protein